MNIYFKNQENKRKAEEKLEQKRREIINKYSRNGDYLITDKISIAVKSEYGYTKESITVEYIEYYKVEKVESETTLKSVDVTVKEDDDGKVTGWATPEYQTTNKTHTEIRERVQYLTDTFFIKTVKSGTASKVESCEYDINRYNKIFTECKLEPDGRDVDKLKCNIYSILQIILPLLLLLYVIIFPNNYSLTNAYSTTLAEDIQKIYNDYIFDLNLGPAVLFYITIVLLIAAAIFEQKLAYYAVDNAKTSSFDIWISNMSLYSYIFVIIELIVYSLPINNGFWRLILGLLYLCRLIMILLLALKFVYSLFLIICGGHYKKLQRHIKKRQQFIQSGKYEELLKEEKYIIDTLI